MIRTKLLLFNLMLLSSFLFIACDDEKEDEEKRENVTVNYTYNDRNLTVLITNNNEEEVKIEIYVRYNSGMPETSIEYIHDKVSIEAYGRLQKDYSLIGELPNALELTYKVY